MGEPFLRILGISDATVQSLLFFHRILDAKQPDIFWGCIKTGSDLI